MWMAEGVRRDEWDRFGQLLSIVHNRMDFSGKDQRQPVSFWPIALVKELQATPTQPGLSSIPQVPFSYISKAVLGR